MVMLSNCTHQNSLGKIVTIWKSEPRAVFVTIKGPISKWQRLRIKAERPQSHSLFPSLMSHSTAKHPGPVSKEWEMRGGPFGSLSNRYSIQLRDVNIGVGAIAPRSTQ